MSVRLALRAAIDQSIEIDGLTPDRVATLSEAEIARLPVVTGSRRAALAISLPSAANARRLQNRR